jgi:hypothetical protein
MATLIANTARYAFSPAEKEGKNEEREKAAVGLVKKRYSSSFYSE